MPSVTVTADADRKVHIARKKMGLPPNFTEKQLRRAYLTGCRKLAPDKGGDAAAFVELQSAHAILLPIAHRHQDPSASKDTGENEGRAPQPSLPRKYKTANEAYAAIHGDAESRMRGYGDWLKREVRPELRPPDKIPEARLHETFDKIANSKRGAEWTVSTHVVQPLNASTSVGHPIHDDVEDFSDGRWMADLQNAYGPA